MKKLIVAVAGILLIGGFSPVGAQIQKGNVMIGGDIAGFRLGLNSGSNVDFTLNPKAAWFIKDGLAVGAYAMLGINHVDKVGTGFSYGVGPLGRYYITDSNIELTRKTKFFMEAHLGIEGTNPASGATTNGLGFGVGPGLAYFITPNIALEALLKYNGRAGFGSEAYTGDLTFGLGFQIYFSSQKVKNMRR